MRHLTDPTPGADVVPITQPVYAEGSHVTGIVIAMQLSGGSVNYLIVADNAQTAPVWVSEQQVDLAYIGDRPKG